MNPFKYKGRSQTYILRHGEGTLKHLKLRLAGLPFIIHTHYIKTPLARRCHMTKVLPGHRDQVPLLLAVHGGFCGLHVARSTSLDLDKTQNISVPADEIDFSATIRRAEISCHHYISAAAQEEVNIFFSPSSDAQVGGRFVRWQDMSGDPVESADGGVSESTGRHSGAGSSR